MKPGFESWGRYPRHCPENIFVPHSVPQKLPDSGGSLLAYGLGRSYGDVCQNPGGDLIATKHLDCFIEFDRVSGVIRCESGLTLGTILEVVVPNGWFLPSTPGTQYVTVGGAVANDVHGKNHHVSGTFGRHVKQFGLLRSNGEYLVCSPEHNSDMYRATIGGLGLTGLVTWVELQLVRVQNPFMKVKSQRFHSLEQFWTINDRAVASSPYTVAWVDCAVRGEKLGRGLFFEAEHYGEEVEPGKGKSRRGIRFPMDVPFSLVNSFNLKLFNGAYFRQRVYPTGRLQHFSPYFYPLDSIRDWNRIYGRRGFFQYQCVVPMGAGREAIRELLDIIAASGQGSFLAVLKTFGRISSPGMLSFPREGVTFALDFSNRGERTLRLLSALDSVVLEAGGALYPAKDARMSPCMFRSGFPRWEEFSKLIDPRFSSGFWQRVAH